MTELTLQITPSDRETSSADSIQKPQDDSGEARAAPKIESTPDVPPNDGISVRFASPDYLTEALANAELLLAYATEIGINVDDGIRNAIFNASLTKADRWSEQTAGNLLTALTQLGEKLKPVTAQSLRACRTDARSTVRSYRRVAVFLAFFIIPFSLASFITSAISDAIRKDIETANGLAVKLRAQLGPPVELERTETTTAKGSPALPPNMTEVDVITELQLFASTIRAIDARARQLNFFAFHAERDPAAGIRANPVKLHARFQLPPGLPNFSVAAEQRIAVYQDVRYFAQSLLDDVSVFYGAIATCVLPVLYALLGACAYLLRLFEEQIRTRTFTPSAANTARFVIAAIGGAIIGLFNNFTVTQGVSIPPLAIAFLVGYAADVFFSFLEGLLQAFTRNRPNVNSLAPSSSTKV